jgi:hypothetical protein
MSDLRCKIADQLQIADGVIANPSIVHLKLISNLKPKI